MKRLLSHVVGFFGVSPYQLLIIAASIALAFTIGLAFGNTWATTRAVQATAEAVGKARDEELARYTTALQEHSRRVSAELEALAKANYEAAQGAYRTLEEERNRAARIRAQVAAALDKEKETNYGLRKVNEILAGEKPPVAECGFSGNIRRVLNEASGASSPVSPPDSDPAAGGTAVPAGSSEEGSAAPDRLTCSQLARGYAQLAEWGREGWAGYQAWQEYWLALRR